MLKGMSSGRALQLGILFTVTSLLFLATPSQVTAQQSQINQQIQAPECAGPGGCPMDPPTITVIDKNGGRPIFTGGYDATFTKSLSVIFGGVVYILGDDGELSVQSGQWRLDLSQLSPPLDPGVYELTVETTGFDDAVERITTMITFESAEIVDDGGAQPGRPDTGTTDSDDTGSGSTEQPGDSDRPRPKPIAPDTESKRVSMVPLAAVLGTTSIITLAGFWFFAAAKRRKRHEEES